MLARAVPPLYWHHFGQTSTVALEQPAPHLVLALPASPYATNLKWERVRSQVAASRWREQEAASKYRQELREREAVRQRVISQTVLDVERQQQERKMRIMAAQDARRAKVLLAVGRAQSRRAEMLAASPTRHGWAELSPEVRAAREAERQERWQRRQEKLRLRLAKAEAAREVAHRARAIKERNGNSTDRWACHTAASVGAGSCHASGIGAL